MAKIAFVGLGIMGKPMSKNLLKAGHSVVVYDVAAAPVADVGAAGGTAPKSSDEDPSQADVIITMLPDGPEVEAAVLGPGGILEGAAKGSTVVDMSSISPVVAQKVGAACAAKGVEFLDAPVSGGGAEANAGTVGIMA